LWIATIEKMYMYFYRHTGAFSACFHKLNLNIQPHIEK
jgi:hypothetical protein